MIPMEGGIPTIEMSGEIFRHDVVCGLVRLSLWVDRELKFDAFY
jgi:hypothetical protein